MWLLYIGTPKYGTCFSCFRPSSGLQPTAPRTFCLIFETPNFLCASLCFNRTSLRRGAPPLSRDWALRGIRSFDPGSYLPVLTSYFGAYSLRRYRLSHPHGSEGELSLNTRNNVVVVSCPNLKSPRAAVHGGRNASTPDTTDTPLSRRRSRGQGNAERRPEPHRVSCIHGCLKHQKRRIVITRS